MSTSRLDPIVLERIDRLELEARQVVEGYLAGRHRSPSHGFAVEFAQHREYVPGDDFKHIDWKVYGRTERYHLKQYEQETNLVAWIVVDASESMQFASGPRSKYDAACLIAAALTYLILQQSDSVGVAIVAGSIRKLLRATGQSNQLREAYLALAEGTYRGSGHLGHTLHELAGRCGRRGIVFIVSDLLDDLTEIMSGIQHLRFQKHEIILLQILDAAELEFPFRHMTLFRGLEDLPDLLTDPLTIRENYLKSLNAHIDALETGCRSLEVDLVRIRTDADLGHELANYLEQRRKR